MGLGLTCTWMAWSHQWRSIVSPSLLSIARESELRTPEPREGPPLRMRKEIQGCMIHLSIYGWSD